MKHSIVEPTGLAIARVLHEDIQDIGKLNLHGLVNCQVQRYFFPTGLAMEVTAKTLWNKQLSFATIKHNYFAAAFGEHGSHIQQLLERVSELLDAPILFESSPEPDPAYQRRLHEAACELEQLGRYVDGVVQAMDAASATAASMRYLQHGIEFTRILLPGLRALAQGDEAGMSDAYRAADAYIVEQEAALHTVCDNRMWATWLKTYAADYEKSKEQHHSA